MKKILLILLLIFVILVLDIKLEGFNPSKYFGIQEPGYTPVIFAPGIVSTGADESSIFFSADGKEIYFTRNYVKLMMIRLGESGSLQNNPQEVSFGGQFFKIGEANISPDGKKIYFNSRQSVPGAKVPLTLWVAERSDHWWGKARGLQPPLNNQIMHSVAIGPDGALFAGGLIKSQRINDKFDTPIKLRIKGHHPHISRDGAYLLYDRRQSKGKAPGIFIVFKKGKDSWSPPRNLSPLVNPIAPETNPAVSPDGRFLFFTRKGDIYWVRADNFINQKLIREEG